MHELYFSKRFYYGINFQIIARVSDYKFVLFDTEVYNYPTVVYTEKNCCNKIVSKGSAYEENIG